jgi:predicted TIM-barrel fold metal-dependent hydrolase
MNSGSFRIDVHQHVLPVDYLSSVNSAGITKSAGVVFPSWDLDASVRFMDRHDIAIAIVSISAPGIYFGDADFACNLARRCNEFGSKVMNEHPQRFGCFATLPLPDLNASMIELEHALDELNLDGVGLLSNVDGCYLGDPAFDDLFAELNRRNAVVFVHPNAPPKNMLPKIDVPAAVMEFVFDTTRAVANLIQNRSLKRYPGIRFIIPHAGGTVPFLAYRISSGSQRTIKLLKNLYFDVAYSATPHALRSLQELADPSHILFGSDYPFLPEPLISTMIESLDKYDGFDPQTRHAVERENALALFPRFRVK